jgi:hypothetical protein
LSLYCPQAAGVLRLGLYDATGPGGGPGVLLAQTAEITPTGGWNTGAVTSPVTLSAGTYWLAYLCNDNNLQFIHFLDSGTNTNVWDTVAYGSMPTTFSASPTYGNSHWSFYASLK